MRRGIAVPAKVRRLAQPWARRAAGVVAPLVLLGLGALIPSSAGAEGPRSTYLVALRVGPGDGGALDAVQRVVTGRTGSAEAPVLYRYHHALGGFAARLTSVEAGRLAADPAVAGVWADEERTVDQAGAPVDGGSAGEAPARGGEATDLLGLEGGLWARLGGAGHAGEGVVVGVLDTGAYPEHPSFADDGTQPAPPPTWKGTCQEGEEWPASTCNHKLIGARWFATGHPAGEIAEGEFLSARDAVGHGSHVASTAVGNGGVHPSVGGNDYGIGVISGIAPRAHLAVYKPCWDGPADGLAPTCQDSDTVAAVDAAVADGVDVLNLSLTSGPSRPYGPLEAALLHAEQAGVSVTTSAGNRGPAPATVGAPGDVPWVTAVAASTLPRTFTGAATVTGPGGDQPAVVRGASLTAALAGAALVDGAAAARPGEATRAALCMPGALDPATVTGKVVLCLRGTNERVEKSQSVHDAGGVGMVLANTGAGQSVVADAHAVPTVHLAWAEGDLVRRRLAGARADASAGSDGAPGGRAQPGADGIGVALSAARVVPGPGDRLAPFSSRGPQAAVPDIGKPDVAAPGVAILAAMTPRPSGRPLMGEAGHLFALKSGASMSSAQVAGVAALLTQLHPDWTPAAIKSALMTTAARSVLDPAAGPDVGHGPGERPAGPFGTGSGRIDPNRAADPGLVLEVSERDWLRYIATVEPKAVHGEPGPLDAVAPVDLNLPAVTYSHFAGTALTRRVFTGVDARPATWHVAITGLPGIAATAFPTDLTVAPGEPAELQLAFTLAGAAVDTFTFGELVLTAADGRTVRLPISIRPVIPDTPAGPTPEPPGPKLRPGS